MALKARVVPSFPKKLTGAGGITVATVNGVSTISYDFTTTGVQATLDQAVNTSTAEANAAAASATTAASSATAAASSATAAAASATAAAAAVAIKKFGTIAAMIAYSPATGDWAQVLDYNSGDYAGGGLFEWTTDTTTTADGGLVIANSGTRTGAWKRRIQ